MTVRNKTPEETAAMNARGEAVANSLIGLIFFFWILYGIIQTHRGHGHGSVFQRFLQNTFSCCAVEPEGDIEKVVEMTEGEPRLSMASMRMEDWMIGMHVEPETK